MLQKEHFERSPDTLANGSKTCNMVSVLGTLVIFVATSLHHWTSDEFGELVSPRFRRTKHLGCFGGLVCFGLVV